MNTSKLFEPERRGGAVIVLVISLIILVGAVVVAWMVTSSQVIAPIPIWRLPDPAGAGQRRSE